MPPITLNSISNTSVKVRWQEPYASSGLNRKMATVVPSGVYRGLQLGVSATALSVDLLADAVVGDHVAIHENSLGYSTTYADNTSGRITLPLIGFTANDVVVICLHVAYASGATTTASFRGYEQGEYSGLPDATKQDLVVLGTVLRPSSGIIPVGNITHDQRRLPFLQRTSEATPWNPLIRNGGFELSQTNATGRHASPFWIAETDTANFAMRAVVTDAHTGVKSMELTGSLGGAVVATAAQDFWMPVTPGRYVMGRLFKKVIQAPSVLPAATGRMRFVFGDLDGLNDVQEDLLFDVTSTDSDFIEVTGIVMVPSTARTLKHVQCIVDATYASAGACIRLDDIQAWAQVDAANWLDGQAARASEMAAGNLFLGAANSFANNSAKISYDGSALIIERRDEDLTQLPPALSIAARSGGGIEYTMVLQSILASGQGYRKYISASGSMLDVVNASYDNSTNLWSKDINGVTALRHEVSTLGVTSASRSADAPWIDGAWNSHLVGSSPETTTLANQRFAPLLMLRDSAGNQRVAIDHLGLRAGRVLELHQPWIEPFLAAWGSPVVGTGSNSVVTSNTDIKGPARRLFVNANADKATSFGYRVFDGSNWSTQELVLEFELSCVDLAGLPFLVFQGGFLHDESSDISTEDFIKISKTSASANWFFLTRGSTAGAGPLTDTGIAAGGLQRFRIEAYGSSTPGGKRALCYINGVLVAELAAFLPDSLPMAVSFYMKATGVVTNKEVIVSPVRLSVTRYLADDAL